MQSKISEAPNVFSVLMTCGIRLNIVRIEAEKAGRKYDRNKVVYAFFKRFTNNRDSAIRRMAKNITRAASRAGYTFDQYFILWLGFKPSPDAHEIGQIIKKGLQDYGYAAAV